MFLGSETKKVTAPSQAAITDDGPRISDFPTSYEGLTSAIVLL